MLLSITYKEYLTIKPCEMTIQSFQRYGGQHFTPKKEQIHYACAVGFWIV